MPEPDDHQLLAEFASAGAEPAFATLVARYVNLVYSTAFRSTGNAQNAEEITQAVFIILARKADKLSPRVVLSGWLYQTTRLTAANFMKGEFRRRRREEEAAMQSIRNEPTDAAWREIAPLLDEAMDRLGQTDRDAVVLRFFENKSAAEIGAALRMNEETARRRVNRALEKLRRFFLKRGVDSTTATISETISANSIQVAPAALAKTATAMALAKGAAASASTLTLIQGALKIMAWTKAKTAIVIAVVAIAAVGTTSITVFAVNKSRTDAVENYFAHWDTMSIDAAPLPEVTILRPTKYASTGDFIIVSPKPDPEGRIMRRSANFHEILGTAYGFSPEQMVLPLNLPQGQFDLLLTTPHRSREWLRDELKKRYGVTAHSETRDMDVLVMKVINAQAPGIKVSAGGGHNIWTENGSVKLQGFSMPDIAHVIGRFYQRPIIDETGVTDAFDVEAKWNPDLRGKALQNEIENMLRNQFGLSLTPDKRPVEVLVVEKAK